MNDFLDHAATAWLDRLVFDFEVSETSPVVLGTWVTVSRVVSLIVDGRTWADILRMYPELSEEDIRACLAYAVELDQEDDRPAGPRDETGRLARERDDAQLEADRLRADLFQAKLDGADRADRASFWKSEAENLRAEREAFAPPPAPPP